MTERPSEFDATKHASPLLHGHHSQLSLTATMVYADPLPGIGSEPHPAANPGEYEIELTLQMPSRLAMEEAVLNPNPDAPGSSLLAILKREPRTSEEVGTDLLGWVLRFLMRLVY